MHRRTFVAGTLAIVAAPLTAEAQRESKVARIGFLVMARNPGVESAFPSGLAELGYVQGRDVIIEWRSADGRSDQLPALAAEMVQLGAEVIVAGGPEARIAAMNATTTIPIVVVGGVDPVAEGWAASLARPGGNATGLTVTYPELIGKKLDILKQLIPGLSRVAVLSDPDAIPPSARLASTTATRTAARSLRLDVKVIEVRGPADPMPPFGKRSKTGGKRSSCPRRRCCSHTALILRNGRGVRSFLRSVSGNRRRPPDSS